MFSFYIFNIELFLYMKNLLLFGFVCFLSFQNVLAQCPNGYNLSENLVENGSFQKGTQGFRSEYRTNIRMILEGTYTVGYSGKKAFKNFNGMGIDGDSDKFLIVNGATIKNRVVWGQRVEITPNTEYAFEMWMTNLNRTNPSSLQVYINGQPLKGNVKSEAAAGKWKQYSAKWYAGKADHAFLEIVCLTTNKLGNDFGIDNISLKACRPIGRKEVSKSELPQEPLCGEGFILGPEQLVNYSFNEENYVFETDYAWRYSLEKEGTFQVYNFTKSLNLDFNAWGHTSLYDSFMVVNGATQEYALVWSQNVSAIKNLDHTFSGWVTSLNDYSDIVLEARIDGERVGEVKIESQTYQWTQFKFKWTAEKNDKVTVSLHNVTTNKHGNDFGIDDLSFKACIPITEEELIVQLPEPEIVIQKVKKKPIEKEVIPVTIEKDKFEEAITSHKALILNNVQFKQGEYLLLENAKNELNQLAEVLKKSPNLKIILKGHTDNRGVAAKNVRLSQRRVTVCKNYLLNKGIEEDRIQIEALGHSQPIASNTTEDGRKKNRRVEVKFIER